MRSVLAPASTRPVSQVPFSSSNVPPGEYPTLDQPPAPFDRNVQTVRSPGWTYTRSVLAPASTRPVSQAPLSSSNVPPGEYPTLVQPPAPSDRNVQTVRSPGWTYTRSVLVSPFTRPVSQVPLSSSNVPPGEYSTVVQLPAPFDRNVHTVRSPGWMYTRSVLASPFTRPESHVPLSSSKPDPGE